jgi:hypothetical protein
MDSIPIARRMRALDAWPAACPRCGGLSFVPTRFGYSLLIVVPVTLGLFLLAEAQGTATRLLGALLVVGCYVCYMRFVPLTATTPESVRFMRWWYTIAWSVLAVLIVVALLYLKRDVA